MRKSKRNQANQLPSVQNNFEDIKCIEIDKTAGSFHYSLLSHRQEVTWIFRNFLQREPEVV